MGGKLLLATNNQAKVGEYKCLLSNLPVELVTLADLGITTRVSEVGESLEENARLKATVLAAESHLVALADDSGLEVDALDGEPGPLSRLEGVLWEKRTARFRCVIAIATPDGKVEICSGQRRGLITFEPRGEYGFGYDPIFYLPELGKTMAELPLEIKNQVSHRGQAARKAYQVLERLKV